MTVVSVLAIPVRPGAEDALVRWFGERAVLARAAEGGGLRGARLLRATDGGELLVVAEWDGEHDYRRWLESPVRAELAAELEAFAAGEAAGRTYVEATP